MVELPMDSRQHKRIIVSLEAELVFGDVHIAGNIENLSEEGIYLITASSKSFPDYTPDTLFELRFRRPSGDIQHLNCRIKWLYKTPPHGLTNSIGMEIVGPAASYKEFLKTLI